MNLVHFFIYCHEFLYIFYIFYISLFTLYSAGPLLSPLSMSSPHHPGGVDQDEKTNIAADDLAMVIGKSKHILS